MPFYDSLNNDSIYIFPPALKFYFLRIRPLNRLEMMLLLYVNLNSYNLCNFVTLYARDKATSLFNQTQKIFLDFLLQATKDRIEHTKMRGEDLLISIVLTRQEGDN